MKQKIIDNINDPEELERLYRSDKRAFSKSFSEVSGDSNSDLVAYWKIRLASKYEPVEKKVRKLDLLAVILLSLVSGLLIKFPNIFPRVSEDFFYPRNLALIVFNGIILYTFWQNRFYNRISLAIYGSIVCALALYVNLLPNNDGDSVLLVFIHVPLLLWCIFGLSFVSFDYKNTLKRIEFVRFNGELLITTGLILIFGGLLNAIAVGLFSVINIDISNFYFRYVIVFGGVGFPMLSIFLIRLYPNLTSKIAPVIARVFTPLVLITLTVYLVAFAFFETRILDDRDLLLLFNVMLLAVMAIIVFSVSELDKSEGKRVNAFILFLLSVLAIVIDLMALFAIVSRIIGGLTPNRTVVLVSNILIFINLALIAKDLYRSFTAGKQLVAVERTVANYLTVYFIWTIIVVFILPIAFGFR